jgi:hypothetical protein
MYIIAVWTVKEEKDRRKGKKESQTRRGGKQRNPGELGSGEGNREVGGIR